MGLDAVELVMAFEKAFHLEISDKDAENLSTVGAVQEYIFSKTRDHPNPASKDEIFEKLRKITSDILSVKIEKVHASSRFVEDLGME